MNAPNPFSIINFLREPGQEIPMYEIVTDFERPDSELVVRASKTFVVITGGIAGPRQVMHATIKPLVSNWRICGPAFYCAARIRR